MYDDVSVTRLSDDDWDDRLPPDPRSRVRVLAVMGAVVVGCGVAAFLVQTLPEDDRRVQEPDEVRVITFPDRTADGGVDVTVTSVLDATVATTTTGAVTTTEDSETSSETPTTTSTSESPTTTSTPSEPSAPSSPTREPSRPTSRTTTTTTTTTTPPPPPPPPPDDDDDDCWFLCW
ncbi:hypothetical protein B0I33_104446 [Prauserella shujinwangii]|uniref:Uncharacterized protein n=1 Tax=Prauserella shujinwangii TaxID=1453103 RepID=A0A2T0LXE7_9PSEU|nr:hypothetical protein [Prauserella shujinwangii]PRX48629.1 hypothetical protein B0I33_104446 [Prauserella shujinwangii]